MRSTQAGCRGAYFGGAGPGGDISLYVGSWAVADRFYNEWPWACAVLVVRTHEVFSAPSP